MKMKVCCATHAKTTHERKFAGLLRPLRPHLSWRAAEGDGVRVSGHDVGLHGGGADDVGVVGRGRAAGRLVAECRDGLHEHVWLVS